MTVSRRVKLEDSMIRTLINAVVSIAIAAGVALPSSAQQDDEVVLTLDRGRRARAQE